MGNPTLNVRTLSERAQLIAAPNTWIEGAALQQLETTAQLHDMSHVVGLPDLHPGRGYPIGAAFFTRNTVYPALIGGDIGCGMQLWQTGLQVHDFKMSRAEKQLKNLDDALGEDERLALDANAQLGAPGTIGGGNHFAELQQLDTVYNAQHLQALGIDQQRLFLLVHSGSRGLGGQLLASTLERIGHRGLTLDEPYFKDYLERHNHALAFAQENRHLIALRILQKLKTSGQSVLNAWHNGVISACIQGEQGWLHRKGAAPADQGLAIIPGSRGDYSYLVEPVAEQASYISLNSIAHGAGRKWMRTECKGKLKNFQFEQLKRSELGSRLICDIRELVFEEAPQAYKSVDTVIEALEGAGLIRTIARLKPVLTYKCRED